jgi:hypothetical protein
MATRLSYVLPVARILARDTFTRLTRGGLASTIPAPGEGPPWLVVAGTGRSGTSAVARVLHESGYTMGASFADASEFNALGFYEDLDAAWTNEGIMASVGAVDLLLKQKPPWRSLILASGEQHADEMRRVFAQDSPGWKHPLFSYTLEAWMRVLHRRPKVVVCLRGPEAYLHSAVAIYGLVDRAMTERAWAAYLERVLAVIRDYRLEALCIEYDRLVADPEGTVARLSRFAGRELDAGNVEASLRTHVYRVPQRWRALYARVAALGGDTTPPRAIAPGPSDAASVARYLDAAREIERRVLEAKRAWESAVDLAAIASQRNGAPDAVRAAAAAYDQALVALRDELMSFTPPDDLEAHFELLRDYIDVERLPEVLIARAYESAEPDRDLLGRAQTVWREHCAPDAWSKAARAREHALHAAPA